jgi:hypothetical protein
MAQPFALEKVEELHDATPAKRFIPLCRSQSIGREDFVPEAGERSGISPMNVMVYLT